MAHLIVALAALATSALTLFSGFGLGTLLLPVFALIFPVRIAVAATAVVHVLNNLFKLALLRGHVDRSLLLRFGVPAALAAFPGAWLLSILPETPLATWRLGERTFPITPIGLVMGALILMFAAFDLVPALRHWRAPWPSLALGGALSGFFGGLSGHQGALRAAFLTKLGLPPSRFVATQAAIACMVDGARLAVYGVGFFGAHASALGREQWPLVVTATLAAFTGAWIGARLLSKVTVGFVRFVTAGLLVVVGISLAIGLV